MKTTSTPIRPTAKNTWPPWSLLNVFTKRGGDFNEAGVGIKQKISRTASSAGGASAERADFHDFNATKQIDKSSPQRLIVGGVIVTAAAATVTINTNEVVRQKSGAWYDTIMRWLGTP